MTDKERLYLDLEAVIWQLKQSMKAYNEPVEQRGHAMRVSDPRPRIAHRMFSPTPTICPGGELPPMAQKMVEVLEEIRHKLLHAGWTSPAKKEE